MLFGSRRIYARLFHAEIDDTGPKRLGRSLMLPPPNPETLRARLDRIGTIAARIERGSVLAGGEEALSPALAALLRGFARAARDGDNPRACARGALAAISSLPENQLPVRPPPPADGTPVTGVMPM
ncbi:MAG: hypothetical protein J0H99_16760, partial [Rhodospirillales bacterium]|nr:hypothetical protein [Rhodospirillales bacterium]